MKNNYIQFCKDYANYSFEIMKDQKYHRPISAFATSLLLRIMKRERTHTCGAGDYSFSITPDLKVYPCHMFADLSEFGVDFSKNLEREIENNKIFINARNCDMDNIDECQKCIARYLCSVFCKGCVYKKNNGFSGIVEDRCILNKIFVTKAIKFLVSDYKENKKIIDSNLYYYGGQES